MPWCSSKPTFWRSLIASGCSDWLPLSDLSLPFSFANSNKAELRERTDDGASRFIGETTCQTQLILFGIIHNHLQFWRSRFRSYSRLLLRSLSSRDQNGSLFHIGRSRVLL